MRLNLYADVATTPKTRAYIRASTASVAELTAEFGVSEKTVRRWHGNTAAADRTLLVESHCGSLAAFLEATG